MIWHLQNLLDNEDLNPAQRRELVAALDDLLDKSLTEKDQRAVWTKIRTSAPTFLSNPFVLKVLGELIADPQIRKAVGL